MQRRSGCVSNFKLFIFGKLLVKVLEADAEVVLRVFVVLMHCRQVINGPLSNYKLLVDADLGVKLKDGLLVFDVQVVLGQLVCNEANQLSYAS